MFRKKEDKTKITGQKEAELREDIVNRISLLLLTWDPEFARKQPELFEKAKEGLKVVSETLSRMVFPKGNVIIYRYYDMIIYELSKLSSGEVLYEVVGHTTAIKAVERMLQLTNEWKNL